MRIKYLLYVLAGNGEKCYIDPKLKGRFKRLGYKIYREMILLP